MVFLKHKHMRVWYEYDMKKNIASIYFDYHLTQVSCIFETFVLLNVQGANG